MKKNFTSAIKTAMFVLLTTIAFALQSKAQPTLMTESFENGGAVPTGWATEVVSGGNTISFETGTTWPTGYAPYDGSYLAKFNSFSLNGGINRLKRTTPISTVDYTDVSVNFAWLESYGYAGVLDKVEVQWSTDGANWNTAGSFYRYNTIQDWKFKNQPLPAEAQGQSTLYIAFLFTSAYGNDCYLDLAHITASIKPPPGTITVGNGTVGCNYPYTTYWMGGRTQLLYTAEQLAAAGASAGIINSIGFNVYSVNYSVMNGFNIKIGNSASNILTGWETNGMQNCYSNNYSVPGNGWQMINLQNPFFYDGSNLIVEFCYANPDYSYYSYVYGTTAPVDQIRTYWMDGIDGCSYEGGNYYGYSGLPNLALIIDTSLGSLSGMLTDCYGGVIENAEVSCGNAVTNTNSDGWYSLNNIPAGYYTVFFTKTGYIQGTAEVTITTDQTTYQDFCLNPEPGYIAGFVTSAATGNPIVGAKITVGTSSALSTGPDGYYWVAVSPLGTYDATASKPGFDDLTAGPYTFTSYGFNWQEFAMLETPNPPENAVATLDFTQTEADISWEIPKGDYELLFDDGNYENFYVWSDEGNLNAVKFTPVSYPATVNGGKINIGDPDNYPEGSNPFVTMQISIYDATGPGGTPGNEIGVPLDFTPINFGWNDFTLSSPVTITGGNFFIVQKQGGNYPDCAGVAVDQSTTQARSYQRFITVGGIWGVATGNLLIRALMHGANGPIPALDNSKFVSGYQVSRLIQGEEDTPELWNYVGNNNSQVIFDYSWPDLPCNYYRWAVQAEYPGNRLSNPVFSNVINKCLPIDVTVYVGLDCPGQNPAGTVVRLDNTTYPASYQATMDVTGMLFFSGIDYGTYNLTVMQFGYATNIQNSIFIATSTTFDVLLQEEKFPPTNLQVDEKSLVVSWNQPIASVTYLDETWDSGNLATNGWTTSGGNFWIVSPYDGNPSPDVKFDRYPVAQNYDQYLTSKEFTGLNSSSLTLNFDILKYYYGQITDHNLAVELWDGSTWTVLKTYTHFEPDGSWWNQSIDLSAYTNLNFKIRFHASGPGDLASFCVWNLDNISIAGSQTVGDQYPCFIAYNVYLNNVLNVATTETSYQIPREQLVYGQTYSVCVKAAYETGESDQICSSYTSRFLCPPTGLAVTGIESSSLLSWEKPQCPGESPCYVYDDGSMENAWMIMPGWTLWLGNKFPLSPAENGILSSFKMKWWDHPTATTQNLQIDIFDMDGILLGSTQLFQVPVPAPIGYFVVICENPIPFSGPFYAMVKWNNFDGYTHFLGSDENGPFASDNLAFGYDGTTFAEWSNYAGTPPGVFTLQACGIVSGTRVAINSDGISLEKPNQTQTPCTATDPEGAISHRPDGEIPPTAIIPDETDAPLVTGLMGYNIFRSQGGPNGPWVLIKQLTDPNTLSWYDGDLNPGDWCYKVTAFYDLTAFGFPGSIDESMPDGSQCASLTYGRPLPFCENWDEGSFEYNNWTFNSGVQGNWIINSGTGNPAPGATFNSQPTTTYYNFSLESPVFDARFWTCAELWLDFDLKLEDLSMSSTERLTIEILYHGTWHQIDDFMNNGNIAWTNRHIDISAAKGEAFRVRFRAHGWNTDYINNWNVDNICVSGICAPPTGLAASRTGLSTTLTWSEPVCGSTGMEPVWINWDSGLNATSVGTGGAAFFEVAVRWDAAQIAALAGGQVTKIAFFPTSAGTADYRIRVWQGPNAATLLVDQAVPVVNLDEWNIIDVISPVPIDVNQELWIGLNVNASGGWPPGCDAGPAIAGYGDMMYWDGAWRPMSLDYGLNYNWNIQGYVESVTAKGSIYEVMIPVQNTTCKSVGTLSSSGFSNLNKTKASPATMSKEKLSDSGNQPTMSIVPNNRDGGSNLAGYNVYRTTGEPGTGPFTIINEAPVTGTSFEDIYPSNTTPGDVFRYFVTDLFIDPENNTLLCESSSDTITVNFEADQLVSIPAGWSGLSSYIVPADPDAETIFSPIISKLIITYNMAGMYYPAVPVNTLGSWDVYSGYVIKLNDASGLPFWGSEVTNKTVSLNTGWNLMPVLSSSPYNIVTLFTGVPGFTIAKDVAGSVVYWKSYGINTIGNVLPGKAYYVRMSSAGSINYSLPADNSTSIKPPENTQVSTPWNAVINTPASHLVAFNIQNSAFQTGDVVGGFTQEGWCAGAVGVTDPSIPFALNLNSDDAYSSEKDGFETGEILNYQLYRPSTGETFDLEVTYNPEMNTGNFENNGLSEVNAVKMSATGISNPASDNLKVYPNPAKEMLIIESASIIREVDIMNFTGQTVYTNTSVDSKTMQVNVSAFATGVYFVKIKTDKGIRATKITVN